MLYCVTGLCICDWPYLALLLFWPIWCCDYLLWNVDIVTDISFILFTTVTDILWYLIFDNILFGMLTIFIYSCYNVVHYSFDGVNDIYLVMLLALSSLFNVIYNIWLRHVVHRRGPNWLTIYDWNVVALNDVTVFCGRYICGVINGPGPGRLADIAGGTYLSAYVSY